MPEIKVSISHFTAFYTIAFIRIDRSLSEKRSGEMWSFSCFDKRWCATGRKRAKRPGTRTWKSGSGRKKHSGRTTYKCAGSGRCHSSSPELHAFVALSLQPIHFNTREGGGLCLFIEREKLSETVATRLLLRGAFRSDWIYATRAVYLIQNMATHQK